MSKVKLTLISEDVERDPFNRIFSITNAYRTHPIDEFPKDGDFWVTVFWEDSGDEDIQVSFQILNTVGDVIAAKPPALAFVDKFLKITFAHFAEVFYEEPGIYSVNVYADGLLADTIQFTLTDFFGGDGPPFLGMTDHP